MVRSRGTTPARMRPRGRGRGRSNEPTNMENDTVVPEIKEFWEAKYEQYFEDHANQPIVPGMAYDFNMLRENGFENVVEAIEFQGWREFCSTNKPMDQLLIRKWYANLLPSDDTISFETLIHGHEISWGPPMLRTFLNESFESSAIPSGGLRFEHNNKDSELLPNFNKEKMFSELFEPEYAGKHSNNASHLTVANRLIHHIIVHTLVPQRGSLTTMNHTGLCLLHCIVNKIKVNLQCSIINHMINIRKNPRSAYAYGMLITDYCHMKYVLRSLTPMVRDCGKFKEGGLSRLFTKNDDGSWSKGSSSGSKRQRTQGGLELVLSTSTAPTWTTPSTSTMPPSSTGASSIPVPPENVNAYASNPYMDPYAHMSQQVPAYNGQQGAFIPPYGYNGAGPSNPEPYQTRVNNLLISQMHEMSLSMRRMEMRTEERFNQMNSQFDLLYHRVYRAEDRMMMFMENQSRQMNEYGSYLGITLHTMENTQRLMGRQLLTLNRRIDRIDHHLSMPPPPVYNHGNDGFSAQSYEGFGIDPPTPHEDYF